MMRRLPKKEIIFILLSLAMVGIFLSLAHWQWQRLGEKQSMVAALRTPPGDAVALPVDDATPLCVPYRFTIRQGMVDQTKPLFRPGAINPAMQGIGRVGFNLYFPLVNANNDRAILVDFGWVDSDMRQLILDNARDHKVQAVLQTIRGWAWPAQRKTIFIPENDPQSDIWYWPDMAALQAYTGYVFAPCVLYNSLNWFGAIRPSLADTIPNNHLQYVWTWLGLALVQILVTGYYIGKQLSQK